MWMFPFAYGGPSCRMNLGAFLRRSRIFSYRLISAHRASVTGSLAGRFAFIGKPVCGRLTVSFHSGMDIRRFYNELLVRSGNRVTERAVRRDKRGALDRD